MNDLLFDASSLIDLIRSSDEKIKTELIGQAMILDLTYYELGNSIWKGAELTKSLSEAETKELTDAMGKTLGALERIAPSSPDFSDILDIAVKERLTFYDASYIYLAKKKTLTLVTQDDRLSRIAKKYVKTVSVADIAKGN